jgi:hypothetical protein
VANAAAAVIVSGGHEYAVYELAGREILDQAQVAGVLAQQLGRPVRAEAIDRGFWAESARRGGQDAEAVDTLLRMFEYYEQYGFYGNATMLKALLRREPTTFAQATARQVATMGG